jgi:ribonuclease HI
MSKAAIVAISQAINYGLAEITVHTDSKFMISCMETWLAGWKRNNWRKKDGQPVINEEEIRRLDFLCSKIKVIWVIR